MAVLCRYRGLLFMLLSVLSWPFVAAADGAIVQHDLAVRLFPGEHRIEVRDRIRLPGTDADSVLFVLNRGLELEAVAGVKALTPLRSAGRATFYRLIPDGQTREVSLRYKGRIHALSPASSDGSDPISTDGVFLNAASLWYPALLNDDSRLVFRLDVRLPAHWRSVSQGRCDLVADEGDEGDEGLGERWSETHPQEQIYLLAARFSEYEQDLGGITAQAFLRRADEDLARRYLQATARYLKMYDRLIGPYPYAKFALVENLRETGFGMPSFTLLGPRVIRLPFILTSSYPHEILHNWWGNGVYVDYEHGNWSEGLTAYLADHLFREAAGQGAQYRMQALQKYTDYAASGRDFPLSGFHSRHSAATEAVGYGKALMIFHMLRRQLGDEKFIGALRGFYRDRQFTVSGFDDLRHAFEQVAGHSLKSFFDQWVERTGAPALSLREAQVSQRGARYILDFSLAQTQPGEPYTLRVPVAVTLAGRAEAYETTVEMTETDQRFSLALPAQAVRLDIDPDFDLFRRLDPSESPAAWSGVFGSKRLTIVLPTGIDAQRLAAYRDLADALKRSGPEKVSIVSADDVDVLPERGAVIVLAWENALLPRVEKVFAALGVRLGASRSEIAGEGVARRGHVLALVARRSGDRGPLAFIAADGVAALPGLARKLPHYHKYSYLAFAGDAPRNVLKGRWPVTDSPLGISLKQGTRPARRALRRPLADDR